MQTLAGPPTVGITANLWDYNISKRGLEVFFFKWMLHLRGNDEVNTQLELLSTIHTSGTGYTGRFTLIIIVLGGEARTGELYHTTIFPRT